MEESHGEGFLGFIVSGTAPADIGAQVGATKGVEVGRGVKVGVEVKILIGGAVGDPVGAQRIMAGAMKKPRAQSNLVCMPLVYPSSQTFTTKAGFFGPSVENGGTNTKGNP